MTEVAARIETHRPERNFLVGVTPPDPIRDGAGEIARASMRTLP